MKAEDLEPIEIHFQGKKFYMLKLEWDRFVKFMEKKKNEAYLKKLYK